MEQARSRGIITTFYSYKGGTGRSMALANVACLLAAEAREDILLIDWDLEAPGLPEYFKDYLPENYEQQPGLIEFFIQANKTLPAMPLDEENDKLLYKFFSTLSNFLLPIKIPNAKSNIWLLKAGKQDDTYSTKVAGFDWQQFFQKIPAFFTRFSQFLYNNYQHVLVDSRTGHTDTGGICTMLMPENLVLVFTPNYQSLKGVLALATKATDYRRHSDDLRSLIIYPLPSRVETSEPERRNDWRRRYTQDFEHVFQEIYELPPISLQAYFNKAQIQHASRFAYGEEISVLQESTRDNLSMANSYQAFKQQIFGLQRIWETVEPTNSELLANGTTKSETPLKVFISYAKADDGFRKELTKHLRVLERSGQIQIWIDEMIPFGNHWDESIKKEIEQSDLFLLLLSADYLDSDYVFEHEFPRILEKHQMGEADVLPIVLRRCVWEDTPLSRFQVFPKNGIPIDSFKLPDEAYVQIVQELKSRLTIVQSAKKNKNSDLGWMTPPIELTPVKSAKKNKNT